VSINLSGGGGVGGSPPFHNQIMFHTSTLTYINIIPLFASLRFASLRSPLRSFMTFPRPKYNRNDDEKYYMTALARGGWDTRWEGDGGGGGGGHHSNSNRNRGGRGGRNGPNYDSRHDPRYSNSNRDDLGAGGPGGGGSNNFNFAPLPSFEGEDARMGMGMGADMYNNSQQSVSTYADTQQPYTQMNGGGSMMTQSQRSIMEQSGGVGVDGKGGGGGQRQGHGQGQSQDSNSHYSDYYYSQSQSQSEAGSQR